MSNPLHSQWSSPSDAYVKDEIESICWQHDVWYVRICRRRKDRWPRVQSGYNGKNFFVCHGNLKGRQINVACVLGRVDCFGCGALVINYSGFIRRIDGQNGVVEWLDGQP
jgi:hypothetical protein